EVEAVALAEPEHLVLDLELERARQHQSELLARVVVGALRALARGDRHRDRLHLLPTLARDQELLHHARVRDGEAPALRTAEDDARVVGRLVREEVDDRDAVPGGDLLERRERRRDPAGLDLREVRLAAAGLLRDVAEGPLLRAPRPAEPGSHLVHGGDDARAARALSTARRARRRARAPGVQSGRSARPGPADGITDHLRLPGPPGPGIAAPHLARDRS